MRIGLSNSRFRVVAREHARTDRTEKANIVCAKTALDLQEMLENKGFLAQSIIGTTRKLLGDDSNSAGLPINKIRPPLQHCAAMFEV